MVNATSGLTYRGLLLIWARVLIKETRRQFFLIEGIGMSVRGVGAWKLGSEYWDVSLNRPIPRRAPGYSSELCA